MGREMLHAVEIDAKPEDVYRAITTSEGLASFWTPDAEAGTEVGAIARFGFGSAPVDLKMRVDELEPDRRVGWTCVGDFPFWEGTSVTWSIETNPEGPGSRVTFGHTGWPAEQPEDQYASVNFTWGQVVAALKAYLESGTAKPALA